MTTAISGLLLLLLTQHPTKPIETRIVEPKDSPVTLIGQPCGEEEKKLKPVEPRDQGTEFTTPAFVCDRASCAVGVRVKPGQNIKGFTIATAMVHDQARVTSAVTPTLLPTSLRSCGTEQYVVASFSKADWPVVAGIIYVAEVTYQNGSTWHANDETVQNNAFRKWLPQPKTGQ